MYEMLISSVFTSIGVYGIALWLGLETFGELVLAAKPSTQLIMRSRGSRLVRAFLFANASIFLVLLWIHR